MVKNSKVNFNDYVNYSILKRILANGTLLYELNQLTDKWRLDTIKHYKEHLFLQPDNIVDHGMIDAVLLYEKTGKPIEDQGCKNKIKVAVLECHEEFKKMYGNKAYGSLIEDVSTLVNNQSLGPQYTSPVLDLLISAWWQRPEFNLNISKVSDSLGKKIVLEIGINTTLKNIKDNWKTIEKFKKDLWPNETPDRITKKTLRNFDIYLMSIINKNSKDAELAADIWPSDVDDEDLDLKDLGKLDKKRIQNIRQIKHRMKKRDN